jgi:hypothetical protein
MKVVDEIDLTDEVIKEEEKKMPKKGELLEKEKSWKDMAEVRMVAYVVPVAIAIAVLVYFLDAAK